MILQAEGHEVLRALRALGGRATRGDLVMATGLPLASVGQTLETLLAEERVQVAVSESAVIVYRLDGRAGPESLPSPSLDARGTRRWLSPFAQHHRKKLRPFDRKTLQLIRARGGVVSIAELVEHTGRTAEEARIEAERLALLFGGEAHSSWDGHVVYAFPALVESAHGDFHVREPRPAWVRADRPPDGDGAAPVWMRRACQVGGTVAAMALGWFAAFPPPATGRVFLLAAVAGASAGAAFVASRALVRAVMRHPRLRLYRTETLRRYLLGYVFETALRGKGVVSLERALSYLRARTGSAHVRRTKVLQALRGLAREFDAPETELDGDRFFGFRNVKRQFLASHVQRVRLSLRKQDQGSTVFDSGDTESDQAARELELFDRDLYDDRNDEIA